MIRPGTWTFPSPTSLLGLCSVYSYRSCYSSKELFFSETICILSFKKKKLGELPKCILKVWSLSIFHCASARYLRELFFFCWNSRHLDISLYSGEVTPLSILACFRQKLITKKHQMSFSIFLTLYRNNGHPSYTIYTHLSSSPILSAKFPKSSTFSCRTYH